MATKFILEDYDCTRIIFDTKERALIKALEWLNEVYEKGRANGENFATFERQVEDMQELIESYADPKTDGFSIDDFCWCYEAEYIKEEAAKE